MPIGGPEGNLAGIIFVPGDLCDRGFIGAISHIHALMARVNYTRHLTEVLGFSHFYHRYKLYRIR